MRRPTAGPPFPFGDVDGDVKGYGYENQYPTAGEHGDGGRRNTGTEEHGDGGETQGSRFVPRLFRGPFTVSS